MKVLVVSTFPPRRCGTGDYTADLAFAMSRLGGLRLRLLTYSDGVDTKFGQENGVEISRTLGRHPVEEGMAAEIESFAPDLVDVAGGTPSSPRTYFFNLRQEGDYPDKLVDHAKPLRLERRVRFTGYVPDELVAGLLAPADAIILPYEGSFSQSGPIHKALSSGRPLIASDVSGSTELLEHGKTALLTPAGDARSLAKAIRRVLIDRQLAERLAQNGRRMAEERLD